MSKSVQSSHDLLADDRRSNNERYDMFATSGEARYQTTGSDRYHCATTDRYSPSHNNVDKYLSLPKPKDRYHTTGRIGSSCASVSSGGSDRSYGSAGGTYVPPAAHTPVER